MNDYVNDCLREMHATQRYPVRASRASASPAIIVTRNTAALFLALAALSGATVWALLGRVSRNPTTSIPAPIAVESQLKAVGSNQDEEITLIKKILTGLVVTVSRLEERQNEISAQTLQLANGALADPEGDLDTKSAPALERRIRVVSEKANLREGPSISDKIVLSVPKETLLLATSSRDGWYEVSTPTGVSAWVSNAVVKTEQVG